MTMLIIYTTIALMLMRQCDNADGNGGDDDKYDNDDGDGDDGDNDNDNNDDDHGNDGDDDIIKREGSVA